MVFTCDFKETVKARVQRDPAFRKELIKEAIRCIHAGDVDTGKAVMRDYINATIGFEKLATVSRVLPPNAKHAQVQQVEPPLNPRGKHLLLSFWIAA